MLRIDPAEKLVAQRNFLNQMRPMNKQPTRYILLYSILLVIIASGISLHAQRTKSSLMAGEQRNAEKGLRDNRYFFYFINTSITNLGTDEEKKMFKEAIQRDIIAQNLYMKFMFGESFTEIRKAQKILIELCQQTLSRDIVTAKKLLNGFASAVVKSNDHLARHYLHLGYRDAADARIDMIMADNFQERLYSMRLYRYAKAIKKVKHGKRYALFSLLETKFSAVKKKEFGRLNYDELKQLISEASRDDQREYHLLVHTDNYYRSKDEISFYDRIWEKPDLFEIKEYEEYMQMK
ncbi:MAG: hypothetical protein A2176_05210 [Spirochaetes bacterium RBG_13_51_14]|nr:MAG: hypothetical protein A2176_05210 [Spirochaetes bacterium RBG_13_51_14]